MAHELPSTVVEKHERRRGRTIIDLKQQRDGEWVATQHDVPVSGSGETAAKAALDYCRRIAEGAHESSV